MIAWMLAPLHRNCSMSWRAQSGMIAKIMSALHDLSPCLRVCTTDFDLISWLDPLTHVCPNAAQDVFHV